MIRKMMVALMLGAGLLGGVLVMNTDMAFAVDSVICSGNFTPEQKEAAGCNADKKKANEVAVDIIKIVLSVVGLLAVVAIILGGVSFMTSTGDAMKVTRAKNTVIYGVVGLIVALLAFAIVSFVSQGVGG